MKIQLLISLLLLTIATASTVQERLNRSNEFVSTLSNAPEAAQFNSEQFMNGMVDGVFGWTMPLITRQCFDKFTQVYTLYSNIATAAIQF